MTSLRFNVLRVVFKIVTLNRTINHTITIFNYELIEFIHLSVIHFFPDFDWVKLGLKMGTIMLSVCTSVRVQPSTLRALG